MESREFLETQPIGNLMLKLSLPTVAAQLVNLLYNLIDRIYIGHIPGSGPLALTGVGVCMPIILIIAAFASLVGTGGAPRASILMGKKDNEHAEEILGESLTVLIAIAIVLTGVLLIFGRPLLLLFGASQHTVGYAMTYMRIYSIGNIFVLFTLGMNSFVTAQGFTKDSMIAVIMGAVLNIMLDPIFIFVLKMGIAGASLATILSQALSGFYILRFLLGKRTVLRIKKKYLVPKKKVMLPCLALGSASFIMQATESVIQVCFNSSLLRYGGDLAVGTMTILSSLLQFVMLPVNGLSQGTQPILSYNFGANRMDRVKETFKVLLIVCLGFTAVMCMGMRAFPKIPVALFTSNERLMNYTTKMLHIYMTGMIVFGIQMAIQCMFTSLGKAKHAILVASMRKLVLLVPLIYILPRILPNLLGVTKTVAVFTAEPVADILSVIFATCLFLATFHEMWKKQVK